MRFFATLACLATVIFLCGCGGSTSIGTPVAGPSTLAYTWTGPKGGTSTDPSFDAVEGNLFQVTGGADIVVTDLRTEQARSNQQSTTVALFDASGSILAQTDISGTDTLAAGYYYKPIVPVRLKLGAQYTIGALHHTGATWNYYHACNTAATPSFITDLGSVFKVSSTIGGATWSSPDLSVRNYMPNFKARQAP